MYVLCTFKTILCSLQKLRHLILDVIIVKRFDMYCCFQEYVYCKLYVVHVWRNGTLVDGLCF